MPTQTSRFIYQVSKERGIWVRQVSSFIIAPSSFGPSIYYVEQPLNSYTAGQLEALCLRWMKAAKAWRKKTSSIPREISLKVNEGPMGQDPYCLRLAPGGRWLLVFDQITGGIYYYDLDTQNPTSTRIPLIPPRYEDGFEQFCISQVDTDTGAPSLTFRICVLYCLEFEATRWTAEIWNFKVVLDESGCGGTSLSATLVASFFFMHMPEGFMSSPTLKGSSALFELTESDIDEPRTAVIIVDWTEVVDGSYDFERRSLLTSEASLRFLVFV